MMFYSAGLGSAADCRADLILDAVNPPGVIEQRQNECDRRKVKRVYGTSPAGLCTMDEAVSLKSVERDRKLGKAHGVFRR